MSQLIDLDRLYQAVSEIATQIIHTAIPDIIPVNKGGTGVTTEEDLRKLVIGFEHIPFVSDSIFLTNNLKRDDFLLGKASRAVVIGYNTVKDGAEDVHDSVIIGNNPCSNSGRVEKSIFLGSSGWTNKHSPVYSECVFLGRNVAAMADGVHNYCIGIGTGAMFQSTSSNDCVAIGYDAMGMGISNRYANCTAIGAFAMNQTSSNSNCTALGYNAQCTGDAQVQLGGSNTTVYAYGSVQNRSDARDKANIRDIDYPYKEFIMGLNPVTFQWDMRDDYRVLPTMDERSEPVESDTRSLGEITHDGSHVRNRRHNGFIAQEVKALMDSLGFDFAGYQDHSVNGGDDVLSLGYSEFIPPIIKLLQDVVKENQEQAKRISELESKVNTLT